VTRPDRTAPGYVPPFGFVVGADGELQPELEPFTPEELDRARARWDLAARREQMDLPELTPEQLDALLDGEEVESEEEEAGGAEDSEPRLWPAGDGSIAHMLRTPPPELTWFCRDRLLSNRAHLLVGIGGSSKTRALIQLAMAAVTGRLAWAWESSAPAAPC